jgi:hypothetical protein
VTPSALFVSVSQVKITPEVSSRNVNRAIMAELVRLYRASDLGMRLPAYDGRKNLYTAGTLPFDGREFIVRLTDDGFPPRCVPTFVLLLHRLLVRDSFLDGHVLTDPPNSGTAGRGNTGWSSSSPRAPTSTISRNSSPGGRQTRRRRPSRSSTSCSGSSATRGTVVLISSHPHSLQCTHNSFDCDAKGAFPIARYLAIGRSFYSPDIRKPQRLGDGLQSWCGFYQSIRPTQMGLSLNIGEMRFRWGIFGSLMHVISCLSCGWCLHGDVDARYVVHGVYRAASGDRFHSPDIREGCHVKAIVGCK